MPRTNNVSLNKEAKMQLPSSSNKLLRIHSAEDQFNQLKDKAKFNSKTLPKTEIQVVFQTTKLDQ